MYLNVIFLILSIQKMQGIVTFFVNEREMHIIYIVTVNNSNIKKCCTFYIFKCINTQPVVS